jgi:ribosomal protein L14
VHTAFEGEGARLVDTIIASVKEAIPNGKVKKDKVVRSVVVHAAIQRGHSDGIEVKFDDNAVVIIDKEGQPKGSRVFGPVPHELRKQNPCSGRAYCLKYGLLWFLSSRHLVELFIKIIIIIKKKQNDKGFSFFFFKKNKIVVLS